VHFGDALISRVRALGNPLCVGLDPHPGRIPPSFGPVGTAEAAERFCIAVVDRLVGRVPIIKPQIAFFEQLGWPGLRALTAVVERARAAGMLVLLDAKRGDIGSTAAGYAAAYLAPGAPLAVDAITLNPYLGLDTLEPFAVMAEEEGRGVIVLVKTSNPGSGDLQDLVVGEASVYETLAGALEPLSARLRGAETGWSSLGVVVGATWPKQHDSVRERLPNALFLVPGYGAQGASAKDAVRGFVPGPNGLEGGIVNSSRGVTFPEAGRDASARAWERAIDDALTRAIGELQEATAASG